MSADSPDATGSDTGVASSLPTYVKLLLLIVAIVVISVTVVDMLIIAGGF